MNEIPLCIAVNGAFYHLVPADAIRNFVDALFPTLAKNPAADCVSGALHRYRGGHDLILDVGDTMTKKGVGKALDHAGHILLTDLPTKAGIPIPLFSQKGLGGLLQNLGLSPSWLNLNLGDTVLGTLALSESMSDLSAAAAGGLPMDFSTFCDTFAEGALEVGTGIWSKNPLLLFAGAENIMAGLVAAWKHFTWYVPPELCLGAASLAGGTGFIVSKFLLKEDDITALRKSFRSALTGGLFTVSAAFGWGLIGVMIWAEVIRRAAEKNKKEQEGFYHATETQVASLQKTLENLSPGFAKMYRKSRTRESCRTSSPRRLDMTLPQCVKLPGLPEIPESAIGFHRLF